MNEMTEPPLVDRTEVHRQVRAEVPQDFEAFFEHHYRDLFGALCLVTRNRHEAEEIAQDTFVRVWERWDRVSLMESPAGYLYRTAMNSFRRRHRRAGLALKRWMGFIPFDGGIDAVEQRDTAVRAMAPLTDRQRAAVILIDLLGYPSEETARMLGVSASTVRNHVAHAHAAMRKTMGEER